MNLLEQDIMYLPGVGPRRKDLLNNELGVATYGLSLIHISCDQGWDSFVSMLGTSIV